MSLAQQYNEMKLDSENSYYNTILSNAINSILAKVIDTTDTIDQSLNNKIQCTIYWELGAFLIVLIVMLGSVFIYRHFLKSIISLEFLILELLLDYSNKILIEMKIIKVKSLYQELTEYWKSKFNDAVELEFELELSDFDNHVTYDLPKKLNRGIKKMKMELKRSRKFITQTVLQGIAKENFSRSFLFYLLVIGLCAYFSFICIWNHN